MFNTSTLPGLSSRLVTPKALPIRVLSSEEFAATVIRDFGNNWMSIEQIETLGAQKGIRHTSSTPILSSNSSNQYFDKIRSSNVILYRLNENGLNRMRRGWSTHNTISPQKPVEKPKKLLSLEEFCTTVLIYHGNKWMTAYDVYKRGSELNLNTFVENSLQNTIACLCTSVFESQQGEILTEFRIRRTKTKPPETTLSEEVEVIEYKLLSDVKAIILHKTFEQLLYEQERKPIGERQILYFYE